MRRIIRAFRPRKTKSFVVLALGTTACVFASVAMAAWLFNSNSSSARGKFAASITLTAVSATVAPNDAGCIPGGKCDLLLTVTGPVGSTVNKAAIITGGYTIATVPASCQTTAFVAATSPYLPGIFVSIPAVVMTGSPVTVVVPDMLSVDNTAAQDCVGADIVLTTTGGGVQVQASIGS